jgi:hypothetical protein
MAFADGFLALVIGSEWMARRRITITRFVASVEKFLILNGNTFLCQRPRLSCRTV